MIVVGNRVTWETFLRSRFVIFWCQKYVKRAHRNGKKKLPRALKKVSQVALFPTTNITHKNCQGRKNMPYNLNNVEKLPPISIR